MAADPRSATPAGARPEVVAVTAKTWPPQLLPALQSVYVVHELPVGAMAECEKHIGAYAARVRALVTQTAPGASGKLIAGLPRLEIIACSGAHVDRIDLAACRARHIAVTNTPGQSVNDVADFVLAHLLALARRIAEADRFVRAHRWPQGILPLSRRVSGKTIGIVGLGMIGQTVARRVQGFDMTVCYHGPRRKPEFPYRYYDDLVAMARDVDFMVVTCTSGPETRHMIGRPVFEALGPTGLFVNITRGVVDEAALLETLGKGALGGAGIDVYETSPRVPEALMALENVVLTPHVAGFTHELTQSHTDLVMANLEAHFAGRPLPTPVDPDAHG